MNRTNEYKAWEYKEIQAAGEQLLFYLDCYESLGWEQDDRVPYQHDGCIMIRRDRRLPNRVELTRLQRNFESCMNEIDRLNASRNSAAAGYSIGLGLAGCAFMAGSVFAVTSEVQHIVLCILLAIPGFACWGAAPFLFRYLREKRSSVVDRLIENKYDEVYEICKKGHVLLT